LPSFILRDVQPPDSDKNKTKFVRSRRRPRPQLTKTTKLLFLRNDSIKTFQFQSTTVNVDTKAATAIEFSVKNINKLVLENVTIANALQLEAARRHACYFSL